MLAPGLRKRTGTNRNTKELKAPIDNPRRGRDDVSVTTMIVSKRGRVTVPKALRDRLGISGGTRIEFAAKSGQLVGHVILREDPFRKWRGAGRLPGGRSVDQHIARARG
jgi:AbrB family looped-hinge helix DNA binding protein